ncbi:MAG: enoyl-CoA hydratase-related protein [Salinisphaeraceae bacterium]|nr:enoyl-CoA hydratase-related protein [Salinisphaeraceae bacterium]
MTLPDTTHVDLELNNGVLHATINRPEVRNAMNTAVLDDIENMLDAVADDRSVRAIVLRGAGGNFCAGGDLKEMAQTRFAPTLDQSQDAVATYSRRFGAMLRKVNTAPQAIIAIIEGAVLGGGFGLACASDVAIAHMDAKFGLPETARGIPPAQIAPFVVERIGLTQARRLGVCGARFKGDEALRLGLVHFVVDDEAGIQAKLDEVLAQIRQCAPGANAVTKDIMQRVGRMDMDEVLDFAASAFSSCLRGEEGVEGTTAFIEKRQPRWAVQDES